MDWSEFLQLAVLNLGLIIALMVVLWAISLALRDSSIADIYWGMGLVASAWFTWLVSEGVATRRTLVLTLVTFWGVRLSGYILWRNWGVEDPRYARLRKHVEEKGGNYALHSLKHIYLWQGFFMWVTAVVLVFSISVDAPVELGLTAWAGLVLCVLGIAFESIADLQLARFRSHPANAGRIMDGGLWRYSRHPNYFGEACLWVGFFLIAIDNGAGVVTIVSPAVVLFALLGPTGMGLLERRMRKKHPDFEAYVRRTSAFFPRPPKKG